MTALNPKIEPAGAGKVRMTWTPDPSSFGYRFYVNDHPVSKSTKPGQSSTTFAYDGQPTAYGIAAAYEKPAETVVWPAPNPTPSLPIGSGIKEMLFPRTVGSVGVDLPGQGPSGSAPEDFTEMEYDGWGTGSVGGRLTYAADPLDANHTVVRFKIFYGDLAEDRWGPDGQRMELWKYDLGFENQEGTSAWFAWSWFLGDGANGDLFKAPNGWALMFQHHDRDLRVSGGSPPQALEITPAMRWVWNMRTIATDETGREDIGAATRGVWHHFLNYMYFSFSSAGVCRVWHATGAQPDPYSTPVYESVGRNTIYDGNWGMTTHHMYREPSSRPADYPWTAYAGGFARAATAAKALELAASR